MQSNQLLNNFSRRGGFKKALYLSLSTFLILNFQNCTDVSFSSRSESNTNGPAVSNPNVPVGNEDLGLLGGHFDLDTSTQIYPFNKGTTDHHVHEYDDKHNIQYADFFNLLDSGFSNINQIVGPDQKFKLIVANATLSPGAIVEINGIEKSVLNFSEPNTIFTTGAAGAGEVQLKSLSIRFAKDALLTGGLVPTLTSCVRSNKPGKLGEYRNGALTIQALASSGSSIDPATHVAASGLLWEATLFWHYDGPCYGP